MKETTISLRDVNRSLEAHNLLVSSVVEAVKPWFSDLEQPRVQQAISDLADAQRRHAAMAFLGLELIPAA